MPTNTEEKKHTPTLHEMKQLIRRLENAAWAVGTDEYREPVSESGMRRRSTELADARETLINAVTELVDKQKEEQS